MCAKAADPKIPFLSKEIGNGEVRDVLVEGFQDFQCERGLTRGVLFLLEVPIGMALVA